MLEEKLDSLKEILKSLGSVAVAYSGGVDSTFLSRVAFDVLGENSMAITAQSETYPRAEFEEAVRLAKMIGIRHEVTVSEELDIPEFADNPVNRCYHCKKELFTKLKEIASEHGVQHVADGSNFDDLDDYRPGMQAVDELEVRSPLKEAGMTKDDIRELSKEMGLPTWDKPSFACLSSRFPYGNKITRKKLTAVGEAEIFLKGLGIRQLRVRHHGDTARIEVAEDDMTILFQKKEQIVDKLKELGYTYVTMDLQGYRTGSMNEVLTEK